MCYICIVNKRKDILKAALKLFVNTGEQATSMKRIAEEAKCGIGTMYNYFQSKDELINGLYLELKTEMLSFILEQHNSNAPVRLQFVNTWIRVIDYSHSNPSKYKFLEAFSHSPKISQITEEKVDELYYPIIEIFEKGKREGLIKNMDTLQLVVFTSGAISASIINNANINEQAKKDIILMAWDAIKL